ncbi:hypothetical protein GCM10010347_38710 [Streptomyces cirratus]|uniref:DUF732 domain-containing protein n=1 Tax=Streptomyces cirratus TaxID=68187 RepID=A0ABQ3EV16_9ACTN|nr:hypothetical protein [Streptomyces cirratus]GHB65018.1 hypothetical protein GCM10010347_38710 [Streptomyces cirratus]
MNHRTATAVLSVVIAAAGLTACGSDKDTDQPVAKKPPAAAPSTAAVPSAAGSPSASAAPAPNGKGIPPKPDAATQAKYIAALAAIDPDIVNTKPDKAVDRGRNQCESIAGFPNDKQKQTDLTNQRFTSPTHPDGFGPAKAAKILDAVHTHLCPSY